MSVRSRRIRVSWKTADAYKNSPSTLIGTITRTGPRIRNVIAAAQSGRFAVRCAHGRRSRSQGQKGKPILQLVAAD